MIELGTPKWQEEEERPMPHPVTDPDLDLNPSLISIDVTALDDTATEDQKPSLLSVVDVHSDILSSDQEEKVKELITEFQDTFAMSEEELLASGVIRRSHSPWASDIVLVRRKDGRYYRRMVKDFSKIAAPLTVLMPTPAKKQRGKRSQTSTKPWNWVMRLSVSVVTTTIPLRLLKVEGQMSLEMEMMMMGKQVGNRRNRMNKPQKVNK
nr:hypothetical protein BaRGS_008728 [Batillaria attramentaria]